MADQTEELVDVDLYDDGSFPDFGRNQAPGAVAVFAAVRGKGPVPQTGLATRRQLRAMHLSPGGHEPVGRLVLRSGRWAWLYRIDLAVPKRTPTLAQERALDRAMAARSTCPKCQRRYHYCLKRAILHLMQHSSRVTPALVAGTEPRYTRHRAGLRALTCGS
ncbi:RRQRL motif-containing zinc-binding protein [Streptomyces viridosporus]|uniref:RRQRL motif-containing zinc-binding protein n=1 Tax=Streptomyces viridosporus TaxID=67581 RepID=UPI003328F47F